MIWNYGQDIVLSEYKVQNNLQNMPSLEQQNDMKLIYRFVCIYIYTYKYIYYIYYTYKYIYTY